MQLQQTIGRAPLRLLYHSSVCWAKQCMLFGPKIFERHGSAWKKVESGLTWLVRRAWHQWALKVSIAGGRLFQICCGVTAAGWEGSTPGLNCITPSAMQWMTPLSLTGPLHLFFIFSSSLAFHSTSFMAFADQQPTPSMFHREKLEPSELGGLEEQPCSALQCPLSLFAMTPHHEHLVSVIVVVNARPCAATWE